METEIIKSDSEGITIQVRIPYSKEMLTTEEAIQAAVNAAGRLAAQHALSQFDTSLSNSSLVICKTVSALLLSSVPKCQRVLSSPLFRCYTV
jgi:ADP-heptose:LPS heptosyltransferase